MKLPDARTPLGMVDANAPGLPGRRIIRSASRNRGSEKGAAALGSNERDGVLGCVGSTIRSDDLRGVADSATAL